MTKRPTVITVVALFIIVSSVWGLIEFAQNKDKSQFVALLRSRPIPIPLQHLMIYAGAILLVVAGIGLLNGETWARYLYIAQGVFSMVINFSFSGVSQIDIPGNSIVMQLFGFALFLLVVLLLFQPKSSQYFAAKKAEAQAEDNAETDAEILTEISTEVMEKNPDGKNN